VAPRAAHRRLPGRRVRRTATCQARYARRCARPACRAASAALQATRSARAARPATSRHVTAHATTAGLTRRDMMTTTAPSRAVAEQIAATVTRYSHRLRAADPAGLREDLARLFAATWIRAARDVPVGPGRAADFLVHGGIDVEARSGGPGAGVIKDLAARAACPTVAGIVLVTRCPAHRGVPGTLAGKPVLVAWLSGRRDSMRA